MDKIIQKLGDGFAGRSRRQEFWVRFLIIGMANAVGGFALGMVGVPGEMAGLLTLPLWLYIAARRLHDLGLTGWLGLIPFAGGFAIGVIGSALPLDPALKANLLAWGPVAITALVVVWLGCMRGQPDTNRFGPPPGQESPAEVF